MTGWSFASDPWDRDLPIDPPTSDFDRYEYRWEDWLGSHYDAETNTVFGIDYDDHSKVYDALWDKFMDEEVYGRYDD